MLASSRARSSAFTLLELTLVLAILASVAALAWPSLQAGMETQRLRRCADTLRNEWIAARVRAMSSGETLAFRHTLQGAGYQVITWSASPESTTGASSGSASAALETSTLSSSLDAFQDDGTASPTLGQESSESEDSPKPTAYGLQGSASYMRRGTLLDRVVFHESKLRQSGREFALQRADELASAVAVQWSSPIFFYPDGATSTATVYLRNEQDQFVRIHLRGLTGLAEISDTGTLEELPP